MVALRIQRIIIHIAAGLLFTKKACVFLAPHGSFCTITENWHSNLFYVRIGGITKKRRRNPMNVYDQMNQVCEAIRDSHEYKG